MMGDSDDDFEMDQCSGDQPESTDDWVECSTLDHLCLFCSSVFSSPVETFNHCFSSHGFDLVDIRLRHCLDCIQYIKLINFIRLNKCEASFILSVQPSYKPLWDDDKYMSPVVEDDPLLCFDIEELPTDLLSSVTAGAQSHEASAGGTVTIPAADYNELLQRLHIAESRAAETQQSLASAMSDMDVLREAAKNLVSSSNSSVCSGLPLGEEAIQNLKLEDDQLYVESYSHFSIHEDMLKDLVRTHSYRDCMYKNEELFRDKIVLDVGCGVGILSLFAAKAGAKHVYGVDQSEIVFQAMDVVRENGLSDKITLIHGKMEDVKLPVDKVDIIISEWMGYFLLFESMLDTVLWARNQYLKPDGLVLPDQCSISLLAIYDDEMHSKRIKFWEDVNGFKMTCMKSAVVAEPDVCVVKKEKVISEPVVIKTLNTLNCAYKDLEFTSDFTLTCASTGRITALVGYFDIDFCCPTKISFSTSPMAETTHWKQTVFLLEKPLEVSQGQSVSGTITCKKNRKDPRTLLIRIVVNGQTFNYNMQ